MFYIEDTEKALYVPFVLLKAFFMSLIVFLLPKNPLFNPVFCFVMESIDGVDDLLPLLSESCEPSLINSPATARISFGFMEL